jgi:hypothetical protein
MQALYTYIPQRNPRIAGDIKSPSCFDRETHLFLCFRFVSALCYSSYTRINYPPLYPSAMSGLILPFLLLLVQLINAETNSYNFHVAQRNVTLSPGLIRPKLVVNG